MKAVRDVGKWGSVRVLDWFVERSIELPWGDVALCAAIGGHAGVLQWMSEHREEHNQHGHQILDDRLGGISAMCGHVTVLEWMRDHDRLRNSVDGSFELWTCASFVLCGTHVLDWLLANGLELPQNFDFARAFHRAHAIRGQCNVAAYQWFWDHGVRPNLDDGRYCRLAAERGDLALLKWLHKIGCHWDRQVIRIARNGTGAPTRQYQELVEWAIANGCPTDV